VKLKRDRAVRGVGAAPETPPSGPVVPPPVERQEVTQILSTFAGNFCRGMVLKKLTSALRPDTTYTYECHRCGEVWETTELRHSAECPECGGPAQPATE